MWEHFWRSKFSVNILDHFLFCFPINFKLLVFKFCHLGWVVFKILLENKNENGQGCSTIDFFRPDPQKNILKISNCGISTENSYFWLLFFWNTSQKSVESDCAMF